ncbi:MAG TPA: LysM domain-containing protein, partial [Anaerolineae bacterium]|nr:LysM domain-containing protein [Anaerolineae bacterium]
MKFRRSLISLLAVALILSSTASSTLASPLNACAAYHVVQAGENLFRIGLQYGITFDVLMQA